MTRGRGPQNYDSDIMLLTTTTRRPILDDDDFDTDPSFISAKTAKRISNQVNDDIDAMQRRSRRQDKILLSDYSPKLATPAYSAPTVPPPVKTIRLTADGPLHTGRRASFHALPTRAAPVPSVVRKVRAPSPVNFVSTAPTVSAVLKSEFHLDDAFGDDEIIGYSRPRSQYYDSAPAGYGYVPNVKHVVPYAPHVSHLPATYAPSSSPRRRPRGSSLPPITGHHGRSSHAPSHVVIRESRETDSVPLSRPPSSVSSLRHAAADAKNKLDVHKSMMDRYLPIYLGPENEVQYEVDYKFGELVQRMPSLDPYRPGTRIGAHDSYSKPSLPPRGQQGSNANLHPKVSQARRRAREVLCRTKGDPHYYS